MSNNGIRASSGVEVKGLEWRVLDNGTAWSNVTVFGLAYFITPDGTWAHRNGSPNKVGTSLDEAKAAAEADYRQRILSCLSSPPPTVEVTATHRHKKRGTDYELIGIGKIQTEKWEQPTPGFAIHAPMSVDGREVAVYRSLDDGHIWVRPREEFEDGRFEAISQNKGEE